MYITLIGGSCPLGQHLSRRLLGEGHHVTVFDNKKPRITGANVVRLDGSEASWYNPGNFIGGEVSDYTSLYYAINRNDIVVNLAEIQYEECLVDVARTVQVNVTGAVNVAQACVANKAAQLIHISSGCVYGKDLRDPAVESNAVEGGSLYADTKVAAEKLIAPFLQSFSISKLRMPFIIAPGTRIGVNRIISNMIDKKPPVIRGSGDLLQDMVYVTDAVEAICIAIKKQLTGTYNVGAENGTSMDQLVSITRRAVGNMETQPVYLPGKPDDIYIPEMDFTKLVNLGFNPKISIEDAVFKAVSEWSEWYQNELLSR